MIDDCMLYTGPMLIKNVRVENPGMLPMIKRASVNPVVRIKVSARVLALKICASLALTFSASPSRISLMLSKI